VERDKGQGEQGKLVLVIEDSAAQRALLRRSLSEAGYRVLEAQSAAAAQRKALHLSPDAVLLGWELRDAEGPDVLRRWKAHPEMQWIPVLMLTSHRDPAKIHEALECGAVDYLHKPPDELELRARIGNAVRIKALHDELRRLASRDPLTGLLNRRVLMDRLNDEVARCRRYGRDLSLAIVDIDHFKRVNDTHGHDVGDLVLTQVANYLAHRLREVDTIARYGGEEFVLVLPETAIATARLAVERLRIGTADERWGKPSAPMQLTFSAGLSCFVAALTTDPNSILKLADIALYRAKHEGRNRVECAE